MGWLGTAVWAGWRQFGSGDPDADCWEKNGERGNEECCGARHASLCVRFALPTVLPLQLLPGPHDSPVSQSRIFNLLETKVIRDLDPNDINKLISISGMVTRTSSVIPDQR